MNADRINQLLERYYNAETTEAEEKELKRFFAEEEVPAHLLGEKEYMGQTEPLPTTVPTGEAPETTLPSALPEA